jgi:hypothetical protein
VTDWWIDPALFAKITRILKAKGIMVSNFE